MWCLEKNILKNILVTARLNYSSVIDADCISALIKMNAKVKLLQGKILEIWKIQHYELLMSSILF